MGETRNMKSQSPIIIIGNGIAGITAARNIRKNSQCPLLVISKESDYFFSRTALMYVYMGHLKWEHLIPYENSFWKKNKIDLLSATVTGISPSDHKISLQNGQHLTYSKLIIASGSTPNKFGWPGQDLEAVQGLYTKQDLETLEQWSPSITHATVVGGGLIGIELAEMLHSRGKKVSFLVRESSFWGNVLTVEEGKLIERHILAHGIDLRLNTNLQTIIGDANKRVKGVTTDHEETIDCEFVGLTAGVRPNIDFLENSQLKTNSGILVDEYLRTNLPDVYAIGDCAELSNPLPHRRPVEAVWYAGRMMGETIAQTLTNQPTPYRPAHWFNSAKFFDIEYQTYGSIHPVTSENEKHFYWQHQTENLAMRFAYHPKNRMFLGINTFGIRLRHQQLNDWLDQKVSVDLVIASLSEANFDPEFFIKHEHKIQNSWLNTPK